MKDYTVEITLTIPFTAGGPKQAEERAAVLEEDLGVAANKRAWAGDVDIQCGEIEEQEA